MSATIERRAPLAPRTLAAPAWPRSLAALVARGLRDHVRSPLTWGGGLGAMSALIAAMWPSIEDSMAELVRNYPEGLKKAFGIQRLDTVEAYVDAEMLSLIIPLALGFFAVLCVTRATVRAEERGHLDVLLSLPVSRRVLTASSFLVTGVVLAAILVVIWALTWVTGTLAGTGISATKLAAGLGNVWPLAMAFAGLAALLAGLLHRPAIVTGATTGTLVGMYVVDLVGKLSEPLEPVRVVSAFR
ncbi:MAG TPA: ABC transporter permease subunit, partial [Solirubrobacteraceae bacterium]|nr:ABC transporter permease subunit [Solirubrobacteraceae bacterium]